VNIYFSRKTCVTKILRK